MKMMHLCSCLTLLLALAATNAAAGGEWAVEIGTTRTVQSKVLDREMTLVVHLPPGYDSGSDRYLVLYMIGSEFRTRFALAASTLDYMTGMGQIPSMLLVGIDLPEGNGVLVPRGEDPDTSGADSHLRFLVDEVFPLVAKSYRTIDYRILYGASNSGLFAVYALLSEPEAFHAFIASSPMLGWCKKLLESKAAITMKKTLPRRHLHVVYSDDDYGRVVDFVPGFFDKIGELGPAWLERSFEIRSNEGHVPVVDLPLGIKAIFPDYNPEQELENLEDLVTHYEGLTKRYGFDLDVPDSMLFDLGVDHLRAERLDQAEEVFSYAAEAFPKLSRPLTGLGLVARDRGEIAKAREWLGKALELDPDDSLAQRVLERLPEGE